jgi:hypothetical protein
MVAATTSLTEVAGHFHAGTISEARTKFEPILAWGFALGSPKEGVLANMEILPDVGTVSGGASVG